MEVFYIKRFLYSALLVLGIPITTFGNINTSNTTDKDIYDKLYSFIESNRVSGSSSVFCVGRDTIDYLTTFEDGERDYSGINLNDKLLQNTSLNEAKKKPINVKVKLTHTPSVYKSPSSVSSVSGKWCDAQLSFNSKLNKFVLSANNLFNQPTDVERGEWVLEIRASDSTGKSPFDKESTTKTTFRVHKAPIPKMTVTETSTTISLDGRASYDVDGSYKNSQGNYTNDKGIKSYQWSLRIDGNWVDIGTGSTVSYNKSGKVVDDYRLTVTDYDGAVSTVSKKAPVLTKPINNFNYYVGGSVADKVYKGNAGNEKLSVKHSVTWNDEAYTNAYGTGGKQSNVWTSLQSMYTTNDVNTLNNQLSSNLNNHINSSNKVSLELKSINKFDLFATTLKDIPVYTVNASAQVIGDTIVDGKIVLGTNGRIEFTNSNTNVSSSDISVQFNANGMGTVQLTQSGNKFTANVKFPDNVNNFTLPYTIKVYSKRDNSYLHSISGTMNFIAPMKIDFVDVQWYVPGVKTNVQVKTNKYVNYVDFVLFKGSKYETTIRSNTPFKTVGDDKYWTVSYVPPADIPLTTYPVKAIGGGISNLTVEADDVLHYVSFSGQVNHTDVWELNRKKYNLSVSGSEDKPRHKDLYFAGERFVLSSGIATSLGNHFELNSVRVDLDNPRTGTMLVKGKNSFTGEMWDKSFTSIWAKPAVYPLVFTFTGNVTNVGDLIVKVPVWVDSSDKYWRQHLKD